jgi:hypothetical protein
MSKDNDTTITILSIDDIKSAKQEVECGCVDYFGVAKDICPYCKGLGKCVEGRYGK